MTTFYPCSFQLSSVSDMSSQCARAIYLKENTTEQQQTTLITRHSMVLQLIPMAASGFACFIVLYHVLRYFCVQNSFILLVQLILTWGAYMNHVCVHSTHSYPVIWNYISQYVHDSASNVSHLPTVNYRV